MSKCQHFKSIFTEQDWGPPRTNGKAAPLDDIKFLSKLSMKSTLPTGSQLKCDRRDCGLCDRSHWSVLSSDTAVL